MSKLILKEKFAQTPNQLLNSKNISLKAKGLYAFIQSKPNDWEFSAERISYQLKEGVSSIKKGLKELEESGYLLRIKHQNNKGHWQIDYELRYTTDFIPAVTFPTSENPTVGNPTDGNPTVGNRPNNSNKDITKKKRKKDKYNIDWSLFLDMFNQCSGKTKRVIGDKTKRQVIKLLDLGYSKENIRDAIINCANDDYHKENPKYLTPEFITRHDKFEKYFDIQQKKLKLPKGWSRMKLTEEQQSLLTKEQKQEWKRTIAKIEIEGGYPLKPIIEYES